eukprot:439224-Pyramimonas_sp.AAC.1
MLTVRAGRAAKRAFLRTPLVEESSEEDPLKLLASEPEMFTHPAVTQTLAQVTRTGERSGRKWGTGYGLRKGEGKLGVSSASLPLLAQEDP